MSAVQVDYYCYCIRWRTANSLAESAPFTIRNIQCHLDYCKGRCYDCDYRLYLFRDGTLDKPVDLNVEVIVGTDVVSHCRKTYEGKTRNWGALTENRIWEGHTSELSKVIADFDRQELLFRVTVLDDSTQPRTAAEKIFLDQPSAGTHLGIDSLSRDLEKLLDPGDPSADVVLRCDGCEFKAHRCLLTSRSEVFASMLRSDMLEGKTGRVEIRDIEANLFELFVRYLYTGKLPELSSDTAMLLYEIGDRYSVDALRVQCRIFLKQNLTPSSACDVLLLADRHSDSDLKEGAIEYMLAQKIPLRKDVWKNFSSNHPVLAVDILNRFCELLASSK